VWDKRPTVSCDVQGWYVEVLVDEYDDDDDVLLVKRCISMLQ
jgi:hypothetical protein